MNKKAQLKVYISGPMTGLEYKEVWHRFKAVQRQIEDAGYIAYNPCSVQLPADATHEQYMQWDLPHLMESDIIYFLDGWEKSHGCRYELQVAVATGKDIRYEAYAKYCLKLKNPRMMWLEQAAELMKTTVADLVGRKRDRYTCNRRLAIIIYLWHDEKLDAKSIGELLHRNRSTIHALYYGKDKSAGDVYRLVTLLHFNPIDQQEPQPLPLFQENVEPNKIEEHETIINQ